jgi:Domain of unknown function (DUF4384)
LNVGRDYTQGTGAAIRTLVDLAMIELVGKWSRLPYWRCLTLDQNHPDLQRQMRDWYDEGSPASRSKLVKASLVSQGYLTAKQSEALDNSSNIKMALGKFQADSGMVVTGVIDFPTYERIMRTYTKLDADGKLITVGWNPNNAIPVPVVTELATKADLAAVTFGEVSPERVLDLQIENAQLDKNAFEVGDQIFLSTSVTRASHVYCYLHEATGKVMRVLPNATNAESLMSANLAVRLPDWMSNKPGFILDASAPGNESLLCIATNEDVLPKLPEAMQVTAFTPIVGITKQADVLTAFSQVAGEGGLSQATVGWKVSPKTVKAAQK